MLCSTTSDSEHPALSSTTCPADTNPCFGHQQGRLLLLHAGQCLWSSTGQAAVYPQRCRPTRSQPDAPNASPRFSATFIGCGARNGFNSFSAFWHSDVSMHQHRHFSRIAFVGQPMDGRRHLCSSTTMTLVVPSVQRSTLGDRAFPVAASRAWNSLPPAIRTVSSCTSFGQQLKTHLFRLSFG